MLPKMHTQIGRRRVTKMRSPVPVDGMIPTSPLPTPVRNQAIRHQNMTILATECESPPENRPLTFVRLSPWKRYRDRLAINPSKKMSRCRLRLIGFGLRWHQFFCRHRKAVSSRWQAALSSSSTRTEKPSISMLHTKLRLSPCQLRSSLIKEHHRRHQAK